MKFSILTESKRKTIISIGAEATSDKTQYLIMIKTPSKTSIRRGIPGVSPRLRGLRIQCRHCCVSARCDKGSSPGLGTFTSGQKIKIKKKDVPGFHADWWKAKAPVLPGFQRFIK